MIHEVSTLQKYTREILFKQAKWFAKDITEFSELNVNLLAKWITIAKKVIRSSRRKILQDRQQRLAKFFSLKPTPSKSSKTTTSSTLPTIKMIQPSIITFLPKTEKERAKSVMNRSNNSRMECTIVTTINNPTHQQLQAKIPIK